MCLYRFLRGIFFRLSEYNCNKLIPLKGHIIYEKESLALAIRRFNVCDGDRNGFSFLIRLDGLIVRHTDFRCQRIDLGAYENPIFPYAHIRIYSKPLL